MILNKMERETETDRETERKTCCLDLAAHAAFMASRKIAIVMHNNYRVNVLDITKYFFPLKMHT